MAATEVTLVMKIMRIEYLLCFKYKICVSKIIHPPCRRSEKGEVPILLVFCKSSNGNSICSKISTFRNVSNMGT